MEIRRLGGLPLDFVSATFGVDAVHHLQVQLDQYLESMQVDKLEAKTNGCRAQYAMAAYKELLNTWVKTFLYWIVWRLNTVIESGTKEEKVVVDSISKYILEMEEFRDLAHSIINRFKVSIFLIW
jgi:hypothetical protein